VENITVLVIPGAAVTDAERQDLDEALKGDKSDNTRRGYASDWGHVEKWAVCRVLDGHQVEVLPMPPDLCAVYLRQLEEAGYSVATIDRRCSAIAHFHNEAGLPSPTTNEGVRRLRRSVRRRIGAPPRQMAPIFSDDLRAYFAGMNGDLRSKMVRALLTVGLAGGFRRSELVALEVADLADTKDGMRATVRKSKTDQAGVGQVKFIRYGDHPETCPVQATRDWLGAAGITEGPVFRAVWRGGHVSHRGLSTDTVNNIVKAAAAAVGKNPADYGAHSLRSGFVTETALGGATPGEIAKQTGHKSMSTVEGYIRTATVEQRNAVTYLGL